jgi:hypothetical protein
MYTCATCSNEVNRKEGREDAGQDDREAIREDIREEDREEGRCEAARHVRSAQGRARPGTS